MRWANRRNSSSVSASTKTKKSLIRVAIASSLHARDFVHKVRHYESLLLYGVISSFSPIIRGRAAYFTLPLYFNNFTVLYLMQLVEQFMWVSEISLCILKVLCSRCLWVKLCKTKTCSLPSNTLEIWSLRLRSNCPLNGYSAGCSFQFFTWSF